MSLTKGYEPRFDRDYEYGRQGELLVDDALGWIARGDGRVEVKRSRYPDQIIYVELQQRPRGKDWRPSGLSTSEADYWFYVKPGGLVYGLPAELLRWERDRQLAAGNELVDAGVRGDNPLRGLKMSVPWLQAKCAGRP